MRIAVTGGIAAGKSTVMDMLAEHGLRCVSADQIAAEVWHDPAIQAAIQRTLGLPEPIDRETVAERVFADPVARRQLNRIMHPAIVRRLDAAAADAFEVPLLIESCLQAQFDRVWLVSCDENERLARLRARGMKESAARGVIASQLPDSARRAFADIEIRTNRDVAAVRVLVSDILRAELVL